MTFQCLLDDTDWNNKCHVCRKIINVYNEYALNGFLDLSLHSLSSFSPLPVGSVNASGRSRWLWPAGIWGYTPRKCCFPQHHIVSSLQRGTCGGLWGAAKTRTSWVCCNSGHSLSNGNPVPGKSGKGKGKGQGSKSAGQGRTMQKAQQKKALKRAEQGKTEIERPGQNKNRRDRPRKDRITWDRNKLSQ